MTRSPGVDLTHRVVSVRDNHDWRRPEEHPHSSWMGQVDQSFQEGLEMDKVATSKLSPGNRQEWRRRVSEATHPRGEWLTDYSVRLICDLLPA